jgi:hypothetical protein
MQVVLDRSLCNRREFSCEACFADHLVQNNFCEASCWKSSADPDRSEFLFKIYDRDQSIKTLVIKQENLLPALVSWIDLWENQAGPII